MNRRVIPWTVALLVSATSVAAEDLYKPGAFSALASDRRAEKVGDSLTVIVNESTTASNSALNTQARSTGLVGRLLHGAKTQSAEVTLNNNFDGSGQTGRTGRMVAQLSVVVDQVLPNGDLHVSGAQSLNINGEKTHVQLSGRVRSADISGSNSVLSTSLAEAVIEYDGRGFVARGAKPGIVTRIFDFLGLG